MNTPEESPHPHHDFWNLKACRTGKNEETTIVKQNTILTQVQTKTSWGERVKIIINKHPNPRVEAVEALQRWMDYTKTTFEDEHVWLDIEGRRPANLQKIKEELTAILRENGIPDTFSAFSIKHSVITH
ncbi:uncharacterized protein MONOS_9493 [Monocercomonoides exilis]|uniref:uncharacterized protein n=1 Tax=Monocercomonoides exilis TaxID=2049356 RepID=UPI003559C1AF|nr:hypothetical protein MONOS_9493 [Monocercomonoides exilis]|eukprot:MONOS_9493.1-p1 / transcript=MONOS_9493.1 / gene=MONOS_9493 / organism=Monocercomonoides_exilis_PA203 / gene_product=unspecified product / transcript_product=unspecified product / location=Mono_scaffold00394:23518-23904(-) / protein_length=129 / sequence_SO=supercontig / SO=protein_coding / is_pseudo=false